MVTLIQKHINKVNGVKQIRFASKDKRDSSSKRDYGQRWRRLRAQVMDDIAIEQGWPYALCEEHLRNDLKVRATDLDHKIARKRGGTDVRDNLQALCHSCHSSKTAKEDGGFNNRKKNDTR